MEGSVGEWSEQTQQAVSSLFAAVCWHPVGGLSQQTQQTADLLVTLICALVVAIHAWDRYNTPESNRVSTTRSAFLFTGAGYVGASLLLFLLLSFASATAQVWSLAPFVISCGLGFAGGFFAPSLYRRALDEEPAARMAPSHAL